MELRPFACFALHLYGSVHGVHNILADGHAQPCTLRLMYPGAVLPGEGFKNLLLELRRHTHAAVLYPEVHPHKIVPFRRLLLIEIDMDFPSLGRKLVGIGQEINQYLVQPHPVTVYILRQNIGDKYVKHLVLGFYLGLDNGHDTVHGFPQGYHIQIKRHLAAFDLGHIQNIVNQSQQMAAGQCYLFQAVGQCLAVLQVGRGDRRHTHNGIHGRPDVMAHVGQELTLGLIGPDRLVSGLSNRKILRPHDSVKENECYNKNHIHQTNGGQEFLQTLPVHFLYNTAQRLIGHGCNQIPFGVGEGHHIYIFSPHGGGCGKIGEGLIVYGVLDHLNIDFRSALIRI